jgi:hypothetical protein
MDNLDRSDRYWARHQLSMVRTGREIALRDPLTLMFKDNAYSCGMYR